MSYSALKFIIVKTSESLSLLGVLALSNMLISCGGSGTETGADPGVEEFPIAFVKRSILVDDNGNMVQPDIRTPLMSTPGGDIFLKTRAAITSTAVNITQAITNGMGDVKDLDVSSDGKLLINDDPKWDIYIYDLEAGGTPQRVITSNLIADEGDDIAPYFLPNNNRIVFSSNRQKRSRSILLDEALSKPQFSSQNEANTSKSLVLHVMNLDGSNIEQISFNQSHDLDPVVLNNGRILFSRWDNINRNGAISLYTILQDGSDLQPYYGVHDQSHDIPNNSLQFVQPRELPNGQIMALQLPYSGTFSGGEIITIDGANYIDLNQPTTANIGALSGPAVEKVTSSTLAFDGSIAIEGRYSSFYPLNDGTNRILVSKGLCQVEFDTGTDPANPTLETFLCVDPDAAAFIASVGATESYPSYGLWLYDAANQTEKPVERGEVGKFIGEAVVMRPYDRATVDLGKTAAFSDSDPLVVENVGILNIRSVYDFGAGNGALGSTYFGLPFAANITDVLSLGDPTLSTATERPARFIRLVKAVGIPSRNDPDLANPPDLSTRAFGRGGRARGMKEIIGYSPIQPDGSVLVKVPADVAFYIEVLDQAARRLGPTHENWLQVKATGNNAALPLPHGRIGAEASSLNSGAPIDGFVYPNTQNPLTTAPYFANLGDTMAEVLSRANNIDAATLDVNVRYSDVWTDPALTPDASFSRQYSGAPAAEVSALSTTFPTTAACETQWESTCRIVINYQEHIQPLWSLARVRLDPNTNLPIIDPNTGLPVANPEDVTCISCHNTVDIANANTPMVPDAQLDLTAKDPSDEENQHIESYRELFFNDNGQILNGGVLVDELITVPALDENGVQIIVNGVPLTEDIPDPARRLSPTMNANGARLSFFLEKMSETELDAGRVLSTPTVNHANMLSPAELRLIAEFLDVGGHYFNNPFDANAPQN